MTVRQYVEKFLNKKEVCYKKALQYQSTKIKDNNVQKVKKSNSPLLFSL